MKERLEVLHDFFEDFEGKKHHFTLVALSKMLPTKVSEATFNSDFNENEQDDKVYYESNIYIENFGVWRELPCNKKALFIGLAICNPDDEFDEKVGKLKAEARARNSEPVILTPKPGIINTKMVKALLEQEAEYIKNNPESIIKGYAERKARFEKEREIAELQEDLSDLEDQVLSELLENPNYLDDVYKVYEYIK